MQEFDWKTATVEDQVHYVRAANPQTMNVIMRTYDWSQHPEAVLGWVAAQKNISLGAALAGFFNGDPWRFNYLGKRDVDARFHGVISLLDTICRRLNAGFYLPEVNMPPEWDMSRLNTWVENQKRDGRTFRRGRWVIDMDILEPFLAGQRAAMEEALLGEAGLRIGASSIRSETRGLSIRKLVNPLAG